MQTCELNPTSDTSNYLSEPKTRTEQKLLAAYAELERQTCELRRSNEELEQFAQIVSHDLKSPLQTVLQFAQILEQRCKPASEEDVQDFALITLAIGRMETLIDDILCYARVSRSDSLPRIPTAVREALQASVANLRRDIAETGAVVTYEDLPTIEVDSSQLLQLFQNLIGNAIHYRSAEDPHIHVSSSRRGAYWLFAVRDNGIGIQPEHQESIFKPFKRLHAGERPGSGIGLAICRKIVERHQGRIWVESEPSKGSTFYFTLRA